MVTTHLIIFFFNLDAGAAAPLGDLVPLRAINSDPLNAPVRYDFLTGDINGPILTWDEYPLSIPPASPSWTNPESPDSPTWSNP